MTASATSRALDPGKRWSTFVRRSMATCSIRVHRHQLRRIDEQGRGVLRRQRRLVSRDQRQQDRQHRLRAAGWRALELHSNRVLPEIEAAVFQSAAAEAADDANGDPSHAKAEGLFLRRHYGYLSLGFGQHDYRLHLSVGATRRTTSLCARRERSFNAQFLWKRGCPNFTDNVGCDTACRARSTLRSGRRRS